ncbi:MAG: dihydrodipicolinate synthase family protein [SAR324 cluster bacterium]|nr:dihydrodipicolinate synthase family protein [SAR324 cluster bacterium]
MSRFNNYLPQGVIPACLLPFDSDLNIDEAAYRKHLRDVAAVAGLSAITTNAHASEVASCTFEEQKRILAITMDEIGDDLPVVNGIYADGSLEAARLARMSEEGGASCLLVFPPNPFTLGAQSRPEMALTHFKTIADATGLPLICFQYPLGGGQGYPLDTLLRLAEEVPSVRAVKDWSDNVRLHERHIRTLQSLPRQVNVLTTHSAWLLSSLVLGCNGLLSGSGSVIADLQAALWQAVQDGDLARARRLNDRIFPLAEVFYTDPFVDMHNRMKEALVILGRIPNAAVRPPLVKLSEAEIARIRGALEEADVGPEGALLEAA